MMLRFTIMFFVALVSLSGCGSSQSSQTPRKKIQTGGDGADDGNQQIPNDPNNPGNPSNPQNPGGNPTQPPQNTNPLMTGGSGGPLGENEVSFAATNGLSGKYKINVPSDISPTNSYGLMVYLHGDGGGEYQWFVDDLGEIAAQRRLIPVLVLAPNKNKVWYESSKNPHYLQELLQTHLFKRYNIDKRKIYFAGASGGSQFLTGMFVPQYGADYQGGSVQMCGGATNWQNSLRITEDMKKNFKLYYYTQTKDFLYDQVEESVQYYKGKGMSVFAELPTGGKHCGFSLGPVLEKALDVIYPQ